MPSQVIVSFSSVSRRITSIVLFSREEGGFILAHWDGTTETEEKIKEETKATIRCIPFESFVPGDNRTV